MDGENTMWKNTIMKFKNRKIEELHNNTYDYFHVRYEMWVSDAGSQTISEENVDHVINEEAQNIIDDGYPLLIRKANKKLVVVPDLKSIPFGLRAYRFYRKYISMKDLEEFFEQNKIIQYEKKIRISGNG
jgi:hypothetical protein